MELTSVANERVRSWLALRSRGVRDATGQFLVEGRRESERIAGLAVVHETIWCEAYAGEPPPRGAVSVSTRVFDRISRKTNPDGVAVVATTPHLGLDAFLPPLPHLVLVADGIEKPGNIGAMLRTCDALGASFLGSGLRTDLVNPNVIRSAQGSLFAVPTASVDRASAVQWCVENTAVVVLRPTNDATLWDTDLTVPTSIVVGAEDAGVDPVWDGVGVGVVIPMSGTADSLNTSVSAAIALAETRRQRFVGTSTT